jgi:hypothetical protein
MFRRDILSPSSGLRTKTGEKENGEVGEGKYRRNKG